MLYFVRPVSSGLKNLIQFRIGGVQEAVDYSVYSARRTRKADYKSRGDVALVVTHREELIAVPGCEKLRPGRRCGFLSRTRHAKTTMTNAPAFFHLAFRDIISFSLFLFLYVLTFVFNSLSLICVKTIFRVSSSEKIYLIGQSHKLKKMI